MKYQFILELGFEDGDNNPSLHYRFASSKSFYEIKAAHERLVREFGIDISKECDEDDRKLTDDFVRKITEQGVVLGDMISMDGQDFAVLYMRLAKLVLPDLEFEMMSENLTTHNIGGSAFTWY